MLKKNTMKYYNFFLLVLFFSSCSTEKTTNKIFVNLESVHKVDISNHQNLGDFISDVNYIPLESSSDITITNIIEIKTCNDAFFLSTKESNSDDIVILKYGLEGNYISKYETAKTIKSFDVHCAKNLLVLTFDEVNPSLSVVDAETGERLKECDLITTVVEIFWTEDDKKFIYNPFSNTEDKVLNAMQEISNNCNNMDSGFATKTSSLNTVIGGGSVNRHKNEFAIHTLGQKHVTFFDSEGENIANITFEGIPELINDYSHLGNIQFPIISTRLNESYFYTSFYSPEYNFQIFTDRLTGKSTKVPSLTKLTEYGNRFDFLFNGIIGEHEQFFLSTVNAELYHLVKDEHSIDSEHIKHIPVLEEGDNPMLVLYDFNF